VPVPEDDGEIASYMQVHDMPGIFVDYLRNGRGATFIVPYSPRARPGAPVAVPIAWDEFAAGVDPAAFTLASVPRRLAQLADPWQAIHDLDQAITARAFRAVTGSPRPRGTRRGDN
jgi:bifunctional non-homologous end joining protein LigD